MTYKNPSNQEVARLLEDIANLLEVQDANMHKVRAYRNAARSVRQLEKPLSETILADKGAEEIHVPGVGEKIHGVIEEYVKTGKSSVLERLMGEVGQAGLVMLVPGIGHELAERIVEKLDVKSLEELEQAAHDGRLAQVEGFGQRRIEAVKVNLAGMLGGFARRGVRRSVPIQPVEVELPDVALLLDLDEEYRSLAAEGKLRLITPKRFNPHKEAWLPIHHVEEDGWDFTVLFSNTARAHELDKTHDWVVIFFEKNGQEGQCTVVTETSGPLAGKRVVRGREQATAKLLQAA